MLLTFTLIAPRCCLWIVSAYPDGRSDGAKLKESSGPAKLADDCRVVRLRLVR